MLTLIVFLYLLVGAVSIVLHFRYFGMYLYDYERDENIVCVLFKSLVVYLFWPIDWFSLWVTELEHRGTSMNIFAKLRKCDACYKAYTKRLIKLETEISSEELTDALVSFFKHMG